MHKKQDLAFIQKADQLFIKTICVAALLLGSFFIFEGGAGNSKNWDTIGGGAVLLIASAFLFIFGTATKYIKLGESTVVFEKKNFFKSFLVEIRYADISLVERTEYFGDLLLRTRDGKEVRVSQFINQIEGPPLVISSDDDGNSNFTVKKMELLVKEIRSRINISTKDPQAAH